MTPDLSGLRIADYLQALGSGAPTPGGGSAAALAGALASALGRMVVSVAQEKEPTPERQSLVAAFRDLEAHFLRLAAEDERAIVRWLAEALVADLLDDFRAHGQLPQGTRPCDDEAA